MPRLIDRQSMRELGRYFTETRYNVQAVRVEMGIDELPWRKLRNLHYLLHLTGGETAIHVLAQLFYLCQPVEESRLHRLVPDRIVGLLQETDLISLNGLLARPRCMISPLEDMLIIADHLTILETEMMPDLVLPPNPTTQTLARFALRRQAHAVLDFGTGSGALALLLAKDADTVLGTDINERAIAFARFNAALNGIENVEFVAGDALQPVAGRKFDLIVANPPFFISPQESFVFCHNSMELDSFCRMLVRSVPEHLEEGGYFQMICEWVDLEGAEGTARLTEWLDGNGCDAIVWKGFEYHAAKYIQERLYECNPLHPEQDQSVFNAHLEYYRDHHVRAVNGGLLAMRRRSGSNWVRFQELQHSPKRHFGEDVVERFIGYDLAIGCSDDQLLSFRPKIADRVRLRRELKPEGGEWKPEKQRLEIDDGLAPPLALDPLVSSVVAGMDGTKRVSDMAAVLTEQSGAEAQIVQSEVIRLVRRLAAQGFLESSAGKAVS